MNASPRSDQALFRRAAERLYRFDLDAAEGRLKLAPSSDECRHHDRAVAITRRRLVHALEIARVVETG